MERDVGVGGRKSAECAQMSWNDKQEGAKEEEKEKESERKGEREREREDRKRERGGERVEEMGKKTQIIGQRTKRT